MENLSNLFQHRRLGIYWAGDIPFINKADAFIEASRSGTNVRWDFNDDVYSSINWKVPIETSLAELYRIRAQQLRDRYDYVSLFFSGGVDSTNVLHAFIDNNILLDEIVMFRPKCIETNNTDLSNRNLYGELDYAALPHLREYLKDPRTVVRFIELDNIATSVLNDDNLTSQIEVSSNLTPTSFIKSALCLTDPIWNNLYQAGKNVCHIQGIDKPHIKIVNNRAYFQFVDVMSFNFAPRYHTAETEMVWKHQFQELFYWTPDLPELVVKQCQVVKKIAQSDVYKNIFENINRLPQDKLEFITRYVYPDHVNSVRDKFAVHKPGYTQRNGGMHDWFFEKMDEYTIGSYRSMINEAKKLIDYRFFVSVKSVYMDDPLLPMLPGFGKDSYRMSRSKAYEL
jgi:hypothetical protein